VWTPPEPVSNAFFARGSPSDSSGSFTFPSSAPPTPPPHPPPTPPKHGLFLVVSLFPWTREMRPPSPTENSQAPGVPRLVALEGSLVNVHCRRFVRPDDSPDWSPRLTCLFPRVLSLFLTHQKRDNDSFSAPTFSVPSFFLPLISREFLRRLLPRNLVSTLKPRPVGGELRIAPFLPRSLPL